MLFVLLKLMEMFVCGEDFGFISMCVSFVMDEFGILGLCI